MGSGRLKFAYWLCQLAVLLYHPSLFPHLLNGERELKFSIFKDYRGKCI